MTSPTAARYDEFADFYAEFAPDEYDDPPMRSLLELIGEVKGLRLLDLACGNGRLTREAARRRARVTGIDISSALIAKARTRERLEPLGITYESMDAASPEALAGDVFDGVICSFGLSDIDDLAGAVATVSRVLHPGGFFAFSMLHPCFPGSPANQASPSWPAGRGYYDEGWWRSPMPAHGIRPRVGSNHRMLSTYVNAFARNELVMDAMVEPQPPTHWIETAAGEELVPIYLVARCHKIVRTGKRKNS
jgi:ubiquinone/menaquinone biosynthesis C-methylase UbiE